MLNLTQVNVQRIEKKAIEVLRKVIQGEPMKNKTIPKVVELAKVYIQNGETYINSIKKAQEEVEKEEKEKYES